MLPFWQGAEIIEPGRAERGRLGRGGHSGLTIGWQPERRHRDKSSPRTSSRSLLVAGMRTRRHCASSEDTAPAALEDVPAAGPAPPATHGRRALHKPAVGVGHSLQHGAYATLARQRGAVSGPARPGGSAARDFLMAMDTHPPGPVSVTTGRRGAAPARPPSQGPRPGSVLTSAGHLGCRCGRSNVCPFPKNVLVGTTPYDPASRLL